VNPASKNNYLMVTVSDTGVGISKENLQKLFTPFFTTKKEGAGLGLMITHEIINQHKGNIKIESKLGEGTKFVIELPIT
jgi:signal transduction histidine kinase